ncbi:MAG TPA: hypothetical protein EYG89_03470 [Bacteroidia bacterium]|nr:hypothetical protein [Bacteroidia bacterium]
MEEVKEEKFGSRNSILKNIFYKNSIEYIANIWVVTCRQAINNDKNTRYLVIIEGSYSEKYRDLLSQINTNVSIINVIFNEEVQKITINNIKTKQKGELSYDKFKKRIIEITNCKFVNSYAMGSKESTPLSRFFREKMGKGFALTDIDFYLIKNKLFIEEKNFIKGNTGYLGIGQCISFKEIINDIFPNIELMIICIHNNEFFISNFSEINCRKSEIIRGWGKMVPFNAKKINKEDLINF